MIQYQCLITGLMVLFAAQSVNATIHNVPGGFPDIQTCINFALDGDECLVAPGTYNESINFIGKAITLRSSGGADVTTIDETGFNDSVVKCISGEGPNTVLEGFTVTGGNANLGGGMTNISSSPTVSNCVFKNNSADPGGGGGMRNSVSSSVVTNCIFDNNSGGGLSNHFSNTAINNCQFISNSSSAFGGGMFNTSSQSAVTNCIFIWNTGESSSPGGIFNFSGSLIIDNCLFLENTGSSGGAIMNIGDSIITNCTFINNVATGNSSGGGIFNASGTESTAINCIFWDNVPDQIFNQVFYITAVTFSNIQRGWPGAGNIDVNPLFADIENGNFHLLPGSPSINMGNNLAVTALFDLDHHSRILCDTVDMGSYESGIGDDDCDGDIDLDDFVGFQICLVEFMLGCEPFDFDGDGDIDLADFGSLQVAFTN